MFCGSKDMSAECGLGGRICRAGQRTCRWSVVCGEKTLRRSKKLSAECGLGGEFVERVKKAGGGVWSRRRTCRAGQEGRRWSVVCGEKMSSGSKDMTVECGLWREITAQVKGQKRPHSKRKRPAKSAPQTWRGASYQIINRTMTFHVLYGRRSFVRSRQKHKLSYRYKMQLPSLRR